MLRLDILSNLRGGGGGGVRIVQILNGYEYSRRVMDLAKAMNLILAHLLKTFLHMNITLHPYQRLTEAFPVLGLRYTSRS